MYVQIRHQLGNFLSKSASASLVVNTHFYCPNIVTSLDTFILKISVKHED